MAMASKPSDAFGPSALTSTPFGEAGREQTEAMLNMQRELLDTYAQASQAWLARVKSEVELWSGLATKLSGTHSLPEALEAYQKCVAQRMQMAAEDGRRLSDDCQKIMQKVTQSLSNGRPMGSS
jgi:hypothetical protein